MDKEIILGLFFDYKASRAIAQKHMDEATDSSSLNYSKGRRDVYTRVIKDLEKILEEL